MGFVEQGGGGHSGERKTFCAFLFKFSFQSFQVYKCGYKSSGKQAKEINLLALYASSRGLHISHSQNSPFNHIPIGSFSLIEGFCTTEG